MSKSSAEITPSKARRWFDYISGQRQLDILEESDKYSVGPIEDWLIHKYKKEIEKFCRDYSHAIDLENGFKKLKRKKNG